MTTALSSTTRMAQRADGRVDRSLVHEGAVVVFATVVAPVLLYVVNLAPLAKLAYPAGNLLLAAYLYERRSPWYAGHVVLLFCFVSLVRRLVDMQAGWDAQNPILLTPYLCGLLAVMSLLNYWMRRHPRYLGAFLVILFAIGYGAIRAMAAGRVMAALVDALKWGLGPVFAVYIMSLGRDQARSRAVVEGCLVWAGALMAVYGVLQFMRPSPWDSFWAYNVIDSGMESLGRPEPFTMRAFSTMNSPGSFGMIMCVGIVVALKRKLAVAVPTVMLMVVGLAICQYRALWAATGLAMLLIAVARPNKALRPANLLAGFLVLLVLGSSAGLPGIREAVAQRAASLNNIGTDVSFEDRLSQYQRLSDADSLIVGLGLGLNGSARKMDDLPRLVIDGGLIELLRSLGIVVAVAYLAAVVTLIARMFPADRGVADDLDFDRAIAIATFVQLPMGSVHAGELGFCAWMFIGFAMARLLGARAAFQSSGPVPVAAPAGP